MTHEKLIVIKNGVRLDIRTFRDLRTLKLRRVASNLVRGSNLVPKSRL